MEKMVDKINAQNPDLVVVAGDIFDNEYEALENPDRLAAILRGIQSKYGVYACYGNHDIQEKILAGFTFGGKEKKESSVKMDEFLENHLDGSLARLVGILGYLYLDQAKRTLNQSRSLEDNSVCLFV